eukprot:snap_masked-scaffold_16-processed-gene-6.65-mRNA-1 protein AED:1.00 eAED:1.00 QI:0/0/0/0/1/1/2/0/89
MTLENFREDLFFRYKFLTISAFIIGTLSHIIHMSNASILKYPIESSVGKINALFGAYLSLFYYLGTFCFLPVLYKILGFENNDKFLKII